MMKVGRSSQDPPHPKWSGQAKGRVGLSKSQIINLQIFTGADSGCARCSVHGRSGHAWSVLEGTLPLGHGFGYFRVLTF